MNEVREMETGAQESAVNKKLLALVGVVLALLLVAICIVVFLLIRSILAVRPAQQQAQPELPRPTLGIAAFEPVVLLLPVVVNSVAPAPQAIPVPPSTLWRFLSINKNDIGTFEKVGDPSQRLVAKCKDPKRPPPDEGELYVLDDSGILRLQDGSKKFQRFELLPGN
jgi:hypothetical protein